MKIYDISSELLSAERYGDDPAPTLTPVLRIEKGDAYNLSTLSLCVHNGTHVDAPFHFYKDGKSVERIECEKCVGYAYLTYHTGNFTAKDATRVLKKAQNTMPTCEKRILIGGETTVTLEAARVFTKAGVCLVGCEGVSVGPIDAPMAVHLELLGTGCVLLEGLLLSGVPEGAYLLSAAPIKIKGADGAPVRAVLIDMEN